MSAGQYDTVSGIIILYPVCLQVKYQTPFNALKPGDYVKCVEDQFKAMRFIKERAK